MTVDDSSRRAIRDLLRRAVIGDAAETAPASLDGIDGAALVEAARMHRVTPAVARFVARAAGASAEMKAILTAERHAQLIRHMRAGADLRVMSQVMDGAGIEWVVAKGPIAADLLWPQPDMREYYDVDVFVARHNFEGTVGALLTGGFAMVDRNWPEIRRTMRAEVALIAPNGTHVDLHWDIAVTPDLRREFRIDLPGMIARARTVSLGSGADVRTFDPVDTLLHLAFHAAQSGANRLMWAGDIRFAAAAERFDWDDLAHRAKAARVELPVALVVDRVDSSLGFARAPHSFVAQPLAGLWGRISSRASARGEFPGLPGDAHIGGASIAAARPTLPATVRAAVRNSLAVRRTERRVRRDGPDERVLWRDVPDDGARADYFAVVGARS